MNSKRFFPIVLLVTAVGAALRGWGLDAQPLSGDDIGSILSAGGYMESGHLGPTMWNHPNLRNVLVYFSMSIFGGVWGVKAASLVLSTLTVSLVALVARRIFNSAAVAAMAAFFLAIDPLHIDFSRQAVHEIYMPFFSLAGIYWAFKYRDEGKPFLLILSGVFFGLGTASKWDVAFPLAVTFLYLIQSLFRDKTLSGDDRLARGFFISCALVMVPAAVYLLTFTPWFLRGYGMADWLYLQKAMFIETTTHAGYNPYNFEIDHRAYLWFIKPVSFVDIIFSGGAPKILIGISNPFVWLLTIPSMAYLLHKSVGEKNVEYAFLFALFLFTYLPFVATGRPIWAHTAFSVTPFAFMATAYALRGACRRLQHGRTVLSVYLLTTVMAAAPLYLLATGRGGDYRLLKPVIEMYRPVNERQ